MQVHPLIRKLLVFLAILVNTAASASDTTKHWKIISFTIHEEIAPQATRRTERAMAEAIHAKADLIILKMDTYGGLVSDADSIRTKILNSPIPVYVFIENNAASAGALISIACNKIYMRKGASIGAATVVDQSGGKVPDKYQSYMRSKMRATAEARGRNPNVAQAMVDGDIVVPGLNDSGKVVTLTASEAMKWGFCDGEAESLEEMLKLNGISNYEIKESEITRMDRLISWLINPAVSGILILLILGGIYFELQSPGIGFALLVSIVAAALYFAPLYLEGLAENWEIIIFMLGIVLLALEFFVIPGFGVAGIAGIICIVAGLILSMVGNVEFDFAPVKGSDITIAAATVISSIIVFMVLLIIMGGSIYKLKAFERVMHKETLAHARVDVQGNEPGGEQSIVGLQAETHTDLKPQGKIKVAEQIFNATSYGVFIEKGTRVSVEKFQDGMYWVKKIEGIS